jgi:hypothetical protein
MELIKWQLNYNLKRWLWQNQHVKIGTSITRV